MFLKAHIVDFENKSDVTVPIASHKGHFIINVALAEFMLNENAANLNSLVVMVEVIEKTFRGKDFVLSNCSIDISTFM